MIFFSFGMLRDLIHPLLYATLHDLALIIQYIVQALTKPMYLRPIMEAGMYHARTDLTTLSGIYSYAFTLCRQYLFALILYHRY